MKNDWTQLGDWLVSSGLEPDEIKRLVVNGQKVLEWAKTENAHAGTNDYQRGFDRGYDAAAEWAKNIMEAP